MPTTYTASDQTAPPRAVHIGINAVRAVYTSTTTLSTSDQILMARIPHGALIIDGYISGTVDNDATIFKVGTKAGGEAHLRDSWTLSATSQLGRFNGGSLPYKVSLSDGANPQETWLYLTKNNAGSLTTSSSIQVVALYSMLQL